MCIIVHTSLASECFTYINYVRVYDDLFHMRIVNNQLFRNCEILYDIRIKKYIKY